MLPFHIHRRCSGEKDLDIIHGLSNLPELVTDSMEEPIDSGKYKNVRNIHLSNNHSQYFVTNLQHFAEYVRGPFHRRDRQWHNFHEWFDVRNRDLSCAHSRCLVQLLRINGLLW